MASPTRRDPIIEAYKEKIALYRQFANACRLLVENLMSANDIKVHTVTCREKNVASLHEKVLRPEKPYAALTDITDLAGVRVITYFEDDVDRVADVIEREFDVDAANSIDKRANLDPDRFGYASLHFVCRLSPARAKLAEHAAFSGLACEIQVRSILQHAWAEIEHDLGYKSTTAVPRHLRRKFSRAAALLEAADEDFKALRGDLAEYAGTVEERIDEDPQRVFLDSVSLAAFVSESAVVRKIDNAVAETVDGSILPGIESPIELYDAPLYRLILAGIRTIGDLETALLANEKLLIRYYSRHANEIGRNATFAVGICLWQLGALLLAKRGDIEALTEEYSEGVAREFMEIVEDIAE